MYLSCVWVSSRTQFHSVTQHKVKQLQDVIFLQYLFFSWCSFSHFRENLANPLSSLSVIHGYHRCVWPCERREAAEHDPQGLWPSFETSVASLHSANLCAEGGLSHRPGERSQHRRRTNHNVEICPGLSRARPPSEGGRFLSCQDKLQRFSTHFLE